MIVTAGPAGGGGAILPSPLPGQPLCLPLNVNYHWMAQENIFHFPCKQIDMHRGSNNVLSSSLHLPVTLKAYRISPFHCNQGQGCLLRWVRSALNVVIRWNITRWQSRPNHRACGSVGISTITEHTVDKEIKKRKGGTLMPL